VEGLTHVKFGTFNDADDVSVKPFLLHTEFLVIGWMFENVEADVAGGYGDAGMEYQETAEALSTYTPTGAATNGRAVAVYSSHATDGGRAIFVYILGWCMVEVS